MQPPLRILSQSPTLTSTSHLNAAATINKLAKLAAITLLMPSPTSRTQACPVGSLRDRSRKMSEFDTITQLSDTAVELDRTYVFKAISSNASFHLLLDDLDAIEVQLDNGSGARMALTLNCPEQTSAIECESLQAFKLETYPTRSATGAIFLRPRPLGLTLQKTGFNGEGSGTIRFSRADRLKTAQTIAERRAATVYVESLALQPGESLDAQVVNDALCLETYLCEPQTVNLTFTGDERSVNLKNIYFTQTTEADTPTRSDPVMICDGAYYGEFSLSSGINRVCLQSEKFSLLDLNTNLTVSGQEDCDLGAYFGWGSSEPTTQQPSAAPTARTTSAQSLAPSLLIRHTPLPTAVTGDPTRLPTKTMMPTMQGSVSPSSQKETPSPSAQPEETSTPNKTWGKGFIVGLAAGGGLALLGAGGLLLLGASSRRGDRAATVTDDQRSV